MTFTKHLKAFVIVILCVVVSVTLYFVLSTLEQAPKLAVEQATNQDKNFTCGNGFEPGIQPPIKPASVTASDNKTHDVIVIGAGMAGLEAANQLDSKGLDVVVLEARDRIGGRINSINYSGAALDLGASWIHGLNKNSDGLENPIYKIVSKKHINFKQTDLTATLYNSTGYKIDDDSNDLYDKYEKFAEKYDKIISNDKKKELSIQKVIEKYYRSIGPMERTEISKYRYAMYSNRDMDQAANTTELAFENSLKNQYFNGDEDNEVIFPDGYNQVINCLAKGLAIKHDIKRATVTKVDYTNRPVIVTTDSGTFRANYTISTLPLGVLQKNKVEFYPPFNESDPSKADAIKHLKMGTMDKVYLIFNYTQDQVPFWSTSTTWINRIPDVAYNDLKNETDKKWQFFFNLYKYDHKPILLAFNTGSQARSLETENDAQIVSEVMGVLKKIYGNTTVPDPQHSVITRWSNEPFSEGSYSYIPVNGSLDDFDKLAKPINDKLFFAGEATNKYYYGTVHSAYISGYRAAEEILKLENMTDSPTEQLQHGIKSWDVICNMTYVLKDITNDSADCIREK